MGFYYEVPNFQAIPTGHWTSNLRQIADPMPHKTPKNYVLQDVRAVYDKVAAVAAEAVSVATVLQPLLDMNQDRDTRSFALVLPAKVALDKDLRDAATRAEKRLEEFQVEMTMRKDVFDNIWAFRLVHLPMLRKVSL